MEPEQGQKSTRKSEEGVRKRLTKGEALQVQLSPTAGYHTSSQGDILAQQRFSSSQKPPPREGPPRRVGRPCKVKGPTQLQVSKPQPTSPAFMSPRAPQGHGLEGPAWQVDPIQPGPSGSFSSSALHAHLGPSVEHSTEKALIHRPSQVSVKQAEEPHKKEKKPQKPGKYICQYCSRPCAKPSVLQKHIRSHTGERPYPCIPCGFSFKTKSNLYKHRKSHAHRIKAGLSSESGAEIYPSSIELERLAGEDIEDPTEGESTDSEDETSTMSCMAEDSTRQKHGLPSSTSHSLGSRQGMSHDLFSLSHPSTSIGVKESMTFTDHSPDPVQKSEDTHTIKQKLALRLSERKKASEEQTFLSPGSKGSTESGYFSRSESAEQQISPPNTNVKSYAEIILGKCGRIGQRTSMLVTPVPPQGLTEEKTSMVPMSVPRTQVIEHITKLITINEAVVDTSEIDSVKPRRSSLSRRSSIESPKTLLCREPFQYDVKSPGSIGQLDAKTFAEKAKAEHSFQQSHSATETVPLLRSHSMPSSACTISSPHPFRASYSFDDRIVDSEVLSHSQVFSSHPRLLKRQPAIELPLGMEYSTDEGSSTSKDTPCNLTDEQEVKESDTSKNSRKGGRIKGLIYECNICGARYKKRGNYETHKKYYCSDLQILKPQTVVPHTSTETEKGLSEHDTRPQTLHYKLGAGLELTPLRKRRKEKSLGDDEDPPSFDLSEYHLSATATSSQYATSDTDIYMPMDATKPPAGQSEPMTLSSGPSIMPTLESKERPTISKEISVIQHTSSFEKSESMEQISSFEVEDKTSSIPPSHTVSQNPRSSHSLQPKLVRQHNIQVPEILVTEEPDKPEAEPEPPPKEEKVEEFQWPQRSQSLSQLPAEKLPPKKKRLRLAEMAQSSGDSSFESMSLTRSPSLESSLSHTSSHSVSFDREEGIKTEVSGQTLEPQSKSLVHHMLTVPSHHHQIREMRRSASEQTPNISHTSQIPENRSKSFDYGSLTSPPSTSGPTAQERRKCFSVRQTSLSRHVELEPEIMPRPWKETDLPSSSQTPKTFHHQTLPTSHEEQHCDSSQQKQSPKTTQKLTEGVEKSFAPQQLSLFPVQPLLHLPEQSSELISSQALADILSTPFSLPQITPAIFHTPPLPLQQTLLHPGHIQVPSHLTSQTVDIPFRQQSSFLPLPFPVSSPISPTFFLPIQPHFALPIPSEVGRHYSQIKPMISPPVGSSNLSPCKDYLLESFHTAKNPLASESPPQMIQVHSDPAVSLVVPVRIQTHMPSYGSAMYTTLSQILVTQPHSNPSSVMIQKFNERNPKGLDLVDILPADQSSLCQAPYLKVPFPTSKPSRYIPFTSSIEGSLGFDGSYSSVGGSKRMLSPAGSLELTMETQQQKRVKEEEISDEEQEGGILKQLASAQSDIQDERSTSISSLVTKTHSTTEILTYPSATPDSSSIKERSQSPLAQSLPGPSNRKSPEQYKEQVYKSRSKVQVKTEDSGDLLESSTSYNPPISGAYVGLGLMDQLEGTETKKVQSFPTLHTTTNVSWCYLNYVKPNHAQQTDRRASVYASWCISLYNPNLSGVSTRTALSLLRSRQKSSNEIYTTADALQPDTSLLVPSRTRKPKMTEAHLPPQVQKETVVSKKEDEKKVRPEEEGSTVRRSEPSRIRIFEGGYKSNEEYVYVRGRGRGKYVCEECGIRCKKPSMLKKHIRTHTDLRPYVCKHCNFAFKTKGNLTKHMKSKAHSKKCQELGLVPPSLAELEAEEGTSEERWQDSDVVEEHQFSDLEDTDEEEDSDDEEDDEEDEEESQEEKTLEISPTVSASRSPNEPSQEAEIPDITTAFQFSPRPFLAVDHPEKDCRTLLGSDLPASRETSPRRGWSPGKDTLAGSRPGPSRRHLLQKRETSPKCSSLTRCPSPRRGMSPCQRLPSTREVSPLRCVSPQHLSSHHDLSPRAYVSPERGSSPPVRRLSPNREVASIRYSTLRGGLSSPPRYPSPGREEQLPNKTDSQTLFKVQHGVFPSLALPHRTPETEGNKQKVEHPDFLAWSRLLRSPHMQHSPPRCGENLFSHLPLHSQQLQRTSYAMIPIGGIQMVQARPGPHPSLLRPPFSELQPVHPADKSPHRLHQGGIEKQLRTTKRDKVEEDRVLSHHSTAPQHPPSSTYCQTTCIPPDSGTPQSSSGPQPGECAEGEG